MGYVEFGMTKADRDTLLEAQGNVCAICRRPGLLLFLDHNHRTGEARGWLCQACNTAIGLFGDDPERLAAAVTYLCSSPLPFRLLPPRPARSGPRPGSRGPRLVRQQAAHERRLDRFQ